MNKKATKNTSRDVAGKLTFRRETIRTLSAEEVARVFGGIYSTLEQTCWLRVTK